MTEVEVCKVGFRVIGCQLSAGLLGGLGATGATG